MWNILVNTFSITQYNPGVSPGDNVLFVQMLPYTQSWTCCVIKGMSISYDVYVVWDVKGQTVCVLKTRTDFFIKDNDGCNFY